MRTLRLFLAGTVILTLLGGPSSAVLGQEDDAELPVPASVVITASEEGHEGEVVLEPGADYAVVRGAKSWWTWDATDPRLSGTVTLVASVHRYPKLYGLTLTAGLWTVTNEHGAWRGEARGFADGRHDVMQAVLTGEGAYDGLTAYLSWVGLDDAWVGSDDENAIRGVIIADELPPFPEPAE